jgi:alanine dehydrogenase
VRVGIPRETKEGEKRVALLPAAVASLVNAGHSVVVETGAGRGIGQGDDAFVAAGATMVPAAEAWNAPLIVKVKELQEAELERLPRERCIFAFHHLPGEPHRTRELASRFTTAIAFEMVRDARGGFPLLAPMSRIAGRLAIEVAAHHQERMPRKVLVLGAGHAGLAAAKAAHGRGAQVTLLTRSASSAQSARALGVESAVATPEAIEKAALEADLVVGAVFIPATPTPKLLPRTLVRRMKRGAMIVDVSIDAGGVAETSRPTSHADPVYVEEGVLHYAVGNMPAADPSAAAAALSEAVLPFVRQLCDKGIAGGVRESAELRSGVLLWRGWVNHPDIAAEARLPYTALSDADLK